MIESIVLIFRSGTTYAIPGILSFFGVIDLAYQTTILINNLLSELLEELEQNKKQLKLIQKELEELKENTQTELKELKKNTEDLKLRATTTEAEQTSICSSVRDKRFIIALQSRY